MRFGAAASLNAMLRAVVAFLLLCTPALAVDGTSSSFAYDQRLGNQLPLAVEFSDEQGQRRTLAEVIGHRPAILALGYFHCPDLCGFMRGDLMEALSRLPGRLNYSLIVLSIDPAETPGDAKAARAGDLENFGRATDTSHWHYLVGSSPAISAIAEATGFRFHFVEADKQFLHPAGLVFLTQDGGVSSYLPGLGYKPNDIEQSITRAANDLSARTLPLSLLLCRFMPTRPRRRRPPVTEIQRRGYAHEPVGKT